MAKTGTFRRSKLSSILVYDIEIAKGILVRGESRVPGIDYCMGWNDHKGMGVSVIGTYDYADDRYRMFMEPQHHGKIEHTDKFEVGTFEDFVALAGNRELLVGFNSIPFDNKALSASGVATLPDSKCYDLLREVWAAAGLGPVFSPRHGGYGLNAICEANFKLSKTGNGALAPILWQQGEVEIVSRYCLNDVFLTKRLLDAVMAGPIKCPKTGNQLNLTRPIYGNQPDPAKDAGQGTSSKAEAGAGEGGRRAGADETGRGSAIKAAGPAKAAGPIKG